MARNAATLHPHLQLYLILCEKFLQMKNSLSKHKDLLFIVYLANMTSVNLAPVPCTFKVWGKFLYLPLCFAWGRGSLINSFNIPGILHSPSCIDSPSIVSIQPSSYCFSYLKDTNAYKSFYDRWKRNSINWHNPNSTTMQCKGSQRKNGHLIQARVRGVPQ